MGVAAGAGGITPRILLFATGTVVIALRSTCGIFGTFGKRALRVLVLSYSTVLARSTCTTTLSRAHLLRGLLVSTTHCNTTHVGLVPEGPQGTFTGGAHIEYYHSVISTIKDFEEVEEKATRYDEHEADISGA